MAQEALKFLQPGEEVKLNNDGRSDPCLWAYHGTVTLDPVVVERRTIGAFKEVAGWQVTVWDVRYGGREEPDSLDDKPMGTYFNISEAVANFVEQVFLCRSKDYWRDLSDRAYADSVMSDAEFY